ncbi:MAG: glycoside hydrolase family 71/99-like protein [Isosphaeraceae bacterium]
MKLHNTISLIVVLLSGSNSLPAQSSGPIAPKLRNVAVDATTVRGKVMCGYQGWFRCPGDAAGMGWIHWSRDARRIAPELLTFEMWPDMSEYSAAERFPAPGFTYPDGRQAELFSADHARTVLRHFEWMRDYGIDGAWLQHFLVDLPGGPQPNRYPSRMRVLGHVRAAARRTGRAWALSYDIADMPTEKIFDVLTSDWKKMVDEHVVDDPRYLHQGGKPVVQIWGFYYKNRHNRMTAELANRLIDFCAAPGRYSAFLVGGGDWNWRRNPDPEWRKFVRRFGAYCPWNIGNYVLDASKVKHASTSYWADDRRECERAGMLWVPVVYPGFSWDNLQRLAPGTSLIARRGGRFLWEQFHDLSRLGVDTVYVAMFDEVDEGTAIFKVTSSPPTQGHFVGFDGLPSDWYLRLVGEAALRLRDREPIPREIPIQP